MGALLAANLSGFVRSAAPGDCCGVAGAHCRAAICRKMVFGLGKLEDRVFARVEQTIDWGLLLHFNINPRDGLLGSAQDVRCARRRSDWMVL